MIQGSGNAWLMWPSLQQNTAVPILAVPPESHMHASHVYEWGVDPMIQKHCFARTNTSSSNFERAAIQSVHINHVRVCAHTHTHTHAHTHTYSHIEHLFWEGNHSILFIYNPSSFPGPPPKKKKSSSWIWCWKVLWHSQDWWCAPKTILRRSRDPYTYIYIYADEMFCWEMLMWCKMWRICRLWRRGDLLLL